MTTLMHFTSAVGNHLWQSTVLAAVSWLLTLALRKNQARTRYWLWMIASVKFLVPFSLLIAMGGYLRALIATPIAARPELSAVMEQIATPFPQLEFTSAMAPSSVGNGGGIWPVVLFALWICGFVFVAFSWGLKWWRVRVAVRAASRSALVADVPVLSSQSLLEPGIVGIFWPVLMLPEGITERLTPAQVDAIVAHEMCHVRRRDNLTAAIHMFVEAVFWFHPMVWWIGSRMVEERERACDEEVLRLGGDPEIYAEGILNVCKFYVEFPLTCVSGISGSDLKERIVRIMTGGLESELTFGRKLLLTAAGIAAVAMPLAFGLANAMYVSAQSPAGDWEKAAGGKMSFDVASVKQNTATIGPQTLHSNIPLGPQAASISTGGLLSSTDWPLSQYMAFAYKLTPSEVRAIQSQLPKWANTNRYDIQARASGDPNEDQFRLMMQALLAERFKLTIHHETRQLPIMALVLDKPGKLGPQLREHNEDSSCATAPSAANSGPDKVLTVAGGFPMICGMLANLPPTAPGRARLGARDVPMSMITILFNVSQVSGVDRPIVDKTGLAEKVDFVIEFSLDYSDAKGPLDLMYLPIPAGTPAPPDPDAPTFLEALKEQLGLKLESQTGLVDVLVIDHVEEPSTN